MHVYDNTCKTEIKLKNVCFCVCMQDWRQYMLHLTKKKKLNKIKNLQTKSLPSRRKAIYRMRGSGNV